ncbi:hypothetical protein FHX03_001507 [Rhizobium sp. BK456]|nr:hypothetical protein [Rhizobium sp. BK456]
MLKDVLLTRATVLRSQENSATIASLIETCKPNAVDPQSYLTAKRTAIVNSHKQSRIDELSPWKEIRDFDFDDRPLKMRWNWQHHPTQDAPTDYLYPMINWEVSRPQTVGARLRGIPENEFSC